MMRHRSCSSFFCRCAASLLLSVVCSSRCYGQQHRNDDVDNVLQHVPMSAAIMLKAVGGGEKGGSESWMEFGKTAMASYLLTAGVTYSLKELCSERRPDGSDRRSLPSGHAAFSFAGATVLRHECGHLSPWVAVGGYGLATFTAARRVIRDRHYVHDVCAGAAIGAGTTELVYFLKKKMLKSRNVDLSFDGRQLYFAVRW